MKKLLIWDGDETLWNGTFLEGRLCELPAGRMALCEELHDRGVLQSVASFNNVDDVNHLLHRFGLNQWFLYSQGWDPTGSTYVSKLDMVRDIIEAYGLRKQEDVVFVDDDPMNRAVVERGLPGLVTAHPSEIEDVVRQHFTKPTYTEEDRLRVRRYQSDAIRKRAQTTYKDDFVAFLTACDIKMSMLPAVHEDLLRLTDLIQRANQMAAIAVTFGTEHLEDRVRDGLVTAVRVSDCYGDYGLCGLVVEARESKGTIIEALVISCRLQGRGIGSAVLGSIINRGEDVGARWKETPYNMGMRALYEWYRFTLRKDGDLVEAALFSPEPVALPPWITITNSVEVVS